MIRGEQLLEKMVPFLSILSYPSPHVTPRKLRSELLYCFGFINKNFIELRHSLASPLVIPQQITVLH